MSRQVKKLTGFFLALLLVCQSVFCSVSVHAKTKNQLNISRKTIFVGKSFSLKVKGKAPQKSKWIWKSSKPGVASVNSRGKVKGKKAGTAKISVRPGKNGKKLYCKVTVKKRKTPATSTAPLSTELPAESVMPAASAEAEQSPQPSATPTDSSILVVSCGLTELDGTLYTAYLVNKQYYGSMTICLNGKSYTTTMSGRRLLTALATGAGTKQNSSATIRVSRENTAQEYWHVEDLELSRTYYVKASLQNTLDPTVAECGVVYVLGDVRTEFEIHTGS